MYLLNKVDYPTDKYGLADRGDLEFDYNDNNGMISIETIGGDFYKIDTLYNNVISYSKLRETSTLVYYDSLLIKLDNVGKALHARHVTYNKKIDGTESTRSQNDSVHFTYNSEYLVKMQSFSRAGYDNPRYTEEYTIENGNIKKIEAVDNSRGTLTSYTYTYDDTEYNPVTKYSYEMPYNTHSLKAAGCILVTNLIYVSESLGKKNKNNVSGLVIHKDKEEYANISYKYIVDEETGLLTQSIISGMVNGDQLPENYITDFYYLKKIIPSED